MSNTVSDPITTSDVKVPLEAGDNVDQQIITNTDTADALRDVSSSDERESKPSAPAPEIDTNSPIDDGCLNGQREDETIDPSAAPRFMPRGKLNKPTVTYIPPKPKGGR